MLSKSRIEGDNKSCQQINRVASTFLLYGASLHWNDAPAGTAILRGAAIAEGAYSGNGAPEFVYDAAVLSRLQHDSGSYVRVPGSWRDF